MQNKARASEPPLERWESTETDPETGEVVRVSSVRRGLLRRETRHFDDPLTAFKRMAGGKTARQALEDHCDRLRDYLAERGLPTDRSRFWIKLPGNNDWETYDPAVHGDNPLALGAAMRLWLKHLEEMTEQLTPERLAGDYLFQLNNLLGQEGVDSHLWHVAQLLNISFKYGVAVYANPSFFSMQQVQKARAQGPQIRRQRAEEIRRIIWSVAQRFWLRRPIFKNDGTNTASSTARLVNRVLRLKKLIPKDSTGLTHKTIADHIRRAIRENTAALA